MSEIIFRYLRLCDQIKKVSNKNKKVRLVAVSKTFDKEKIVPLLDNGHRLFGENKVQEALNKWPQLKERYKNVQLHLIGPLQSNKINQALNIFDCIQTLDREKIVKKISNAIEKNENLKKKDFEFMIQVNIGNEPQKSGIPPDHLKEFSEFCKYDLNLNIIGLMCIPPINEKPQKYFCLLKKLCDECKVENASMGMSNDFLEAISNGSTYIRVGSAIFGKRV